MEEEGLALKYLDLIKEDPSRSVIQLARMFGEIFDTHPEQKDFKMFGRLVKLYGWKIIFYSLIDMYDMENVDVEKYYGLIRWFAKRRLDTVIAYGDTNNLTAFYEKQKQELGKNKHIEKREL